MESMVTQVARYLAAGFPCINIETCEEARAMRDVFSAARKVSKRIVIWSATLGAQEVTQSKRDGQDVDVFTPVELEGGADWRPLCAWFNNPDKQIVNTVLVLLDLSPMENEFKFSAVDSRGFCDMVRNAPLKSSQTQPGCNIVHIGPSLPIPPAIEKSVTTVEYSLPGLEEYKRIIRENLAENAKDAPETEIHAVAKACSGMGWDEAYNAVCLSIVESGNISPEIVQREKIRVIKNTGFLRLEPEAGTIEDVGGLDLLKQYFREVFSGDQEDMMDFGCEGRKGILLIGPGGTGKSLVARVLASINRNKTLFGDIPGCQNSLIGESQKNIRKLTSMSTAMAPCNLFLDEIDKMLAGTSTQNAGDSGVGRQMLGHLMSWLQVNQSVYIVATANSIQGIEAALWRAGRIDAIFSVDYPAPAERLDILKIHLRKRKRNIEEILTSKELEQAFLDATDEFSGAEIEQIVKDALIKCYADGKRAMTGEDLVAVAKRIIPASTTCKEEVAAIRNWCKDNAQPASSYRLKDFTQKATSGRKVQTY